MIDALMRHLSALSDSQNALFSRTGQRLPAIAGRDAGLQPGVAALIDDLRAIADAHRKDEALLAFVGEMSGGKSAIISMIAGYPLFPSATVPTSEAPVEVRYGEKPALEIITLDAQGRETPVYRFDSLDGADPETVRELVDYACWINAKSLIRIENLRYYFDFKEMTREALLPQLNSILQVMQLMLIVLSASVGRGMEKLEVEPENQQAIAWQLRLLSGVFGIDRDQPYAVRVKLPSELLKNGLVLVDLPGLGSGNPLHEAITRRYMAGADAYILPFTKELRVSDTAEALSEIVRYEKMSHPGRDSRFIVCVNKCDLIDPEDMSATLAPVVHQIRPMLPEIQIPVIYPVSAMYAECRLVENGVDPQRTVTVRGMRRGFGARAVRIDPEEAREVLREQYEYPFEYVDPQTGGAVRCSARQFIEEVVGGFAPRIRFLNALKQVADLMDRYQVYARDLRVKLEMLRLLNACGDELMDSLLARMRRALNASAETLNDGVNDVIDKLRAHQQQMSADIEAAEKAFVQGFNDAEDEMKAHLTGVAPQFWRDAFGHVIVDPKATQANVAQHNLEVFRKLRDYLENFNFDNYLYDGNERLAQCLAEERRMYEQGIGDTADRFAAFIDESQVEMRRAYDDFSRSVADRVSPSALRIYESCFVLASDAVTDYLKALSAEAVQMMVSDKRFEEIQQTTTSYIASAILKIRSYYHKTCVIYLDGTLKSTFWLNRSYVDLDRILAELSKHFRSAERNHSDLVQVRTVLTEGEDSHVQRVNAFLTTWSGHLLQYLTKRIQDYIPMVEQHIRIYFSNAGGDIQASVNIIRLLAETALAELRTAWGDASLADAMVFGKGEAFHRGAAEEAEAAVRGAMKDFDAVAGRAREMLGAFAAAPRGNGGGQNG